MWQWPVALPRSLGTDAIAVSKSDSNGWVSRSPAKNTGETVILVIQVLIYKCNFSLRKIRRCFRKSIFYEHMIEFTQIAIPLEKFWEAMAVRNVLMPLPCCQQCWVDMHGRLVVVLVPCNALLEGLLGFGGWSDSLGLWQSNMAMEAIILSIL